MEGYLVFLKDVVLNYGYLIVFIFVLLENVFIIGFLVPGTIVLLVASFYTQIGYFNSILLVFIAYLATFFGDNISFFIGRYASSKINFIDRILSKYPQQDIIINKEWFFIIFNFSPYSRVMLPLFLGASKYPLKKWFIYSLISSFLFAFGFFIIGYGVASIALSLNEALNSASTLQFFCTIILAGWLSIILFSIKRNKKL
ncbi:hypothetical protein PN36_24150 [Candidatus Thiomargarita nelsonii]|uniref:VTT domain-containing protein n=1 Tax=Candidatus Thiomargarita nelsonii TaxID=1003181 RepID=A0A0A6P410_9GAMM|nr:hypothetical protein PN36_24150 [Candidatus Thiomargarita nelsonii]